MVEPLAGVIVTDLSLQNFTVNGLDPKPVPVIVSDPPAPSEITDGDIAEIVGAPTKSTVMTL
jgi:hypothetical protein